MFYICILQNNTFGSSPLAPHSHAQNTVTAGWDVQVRGYNPK